MSEHPLPCVAMNLQVSRTRFEWYDAAGTLLRVDEVEGDGSGFHLDTATGRVRPTGPRAPGGTAHVVMRPVITTEGDE